MSDPIAQFRDVLTARGICTEDIRPDGLLHRADVSDKKRGNLAAAYLLHLDGWPAGGFQNHTDGMGWETWQATMQRKATPAETAQHRERIATMKAQRVADEALRHADCRTRCAELWQQAALPNRAHPYVTRKGITAHGARQWVASLLIPVRDLRGGLHGLQFIKPDGSKLFKTGTHKRGHCCPLGFPSGNPCTVIVCEGWATGCTLHSVTGHAVAVAFDAGNLIPVALGIASRYPLARIIVAGDLDPTGTGQRAAQDAAIAVEGAVVLPDFAPFTREQWAACGFTHEHPPTDFNDLHQLQQAACKGRSA